MTTSLEQQIEQLQARLKESEAKLQAYEQALTEIKDCRITNGSWASLPLWQAMANIATEALKSKGA